MRHTWNEYEFEIYHLPLDPRSYAKEFEKFEDSYVIYIFSRLDYKWLSTPWIPLYIGRTGSSLVGRMLDHMSYQDKPSKKEKPTNCLKLAGLKPSHIHLLRVSNEVQMVETEKELIQCYGPLLNEQHNSQKFLHQVYDSQSDTYSYISIKLNIDIYIQLHEGKNFLFKH